jgi:nicotinate-nucleotide--dimethylbenzimidazole phosphoribosyltransferase
MLNDLISKIQPVDRELYDKAYAHLDNLTKPRGSLGRLEETAARLFAVNRGEKPVVDPGIIYTCAADHGVAAGGVSLFPREVTRQMVMNFLAGGAAINVLAGTAGLKLKVVDVGVMGGEFKDHDLLISRKIMPGTKDLSQGPAMEESECRQAVELGVELAYKAHDQGMRTLCTGEMGIGNTTASTALFCAFLGLNPQDLAGAGTGLGAEGVRNKARIISQGLKVNKSAVMSNDPGKVLAALGGLEIACLAGIIIGGAAKRMNIIIDGYISTAAFVCSWKMNPHVRDYCFFSHLSAEKGHFMVMEAIKARPLLDMDMRLGEGTGAAMAYFILKCAADIFNNMATFDQAGVSR